MKWLLTSSPESMNQSTEDIPAEIKSFFGKEYRLLILAAVIGVLAGAASTVFR
jgi:rRNA-processing protein FCF1